MAFLRNTHDLFARLALLAVMACGFMVQGGHAAEKHWSDQQIEKYIPRLRAIAAKSPVGERSISAIARRLERLKPPPLPSPRKVAIYYDDISTARNRQYGPIYARAMLNLLGHFDITPKILPISRYAEGDINKFDDIFYDGTDPTSHIPRSFFLDAVLTHKTVVWMGDNLYRLPLDIEQGFKERYGFTSFGNLLLGQRTPEHPNPNFYDAVRYKGIDLPRDPLFDTSFSGVIVTDRSKVHVWASVVNYTSGDSQPYILQSGNFWFLAGNPFNALDANRPYLAFCDILHDILGIDHPARHLAMIRLEDVHAKNPASSLRELNRFLKARHIPYSIAVIPHYVDPNGRYHFGVRQELPIDGGGNAIPVRLALQQAVRDGARIVMHGYTHQYDPPGSKTGTVSAEGFEFWDEAHDMPPAGETPREVLSRLAHGIAELTKAGLKPDSFEMPHYRASPMVYRLVPIAFARTYQRVAYYSTDLRDVVRHPELAREQMEQQYPYVIHRDYYGQYVIPENIGYLYYRKDGTSSVKDLLQKAHDMLVVRDGIASLFVHPYLFNSAYSDRAWKDLATIVDGISAMGYRWTNDPDHAGSPTLSAAGQPPD